MIERLESQAQRIYYRHLLEACLEWLEPPREFAPRKFRRA